MRDGAQQPPVFFGITFALTISAATHLMSGAAVAAVSREIDEDDVKWALEKLSQVDNEFEEDWQQGQNVEGGKGDVRSQFFRLLARPMYGHCAVMKAVGGQFWIDRG